MLSDCVDLELLLIKYHTLSKKSYSVDCMYATELSVDEKFSLIITLEIKTPAENVFIKQPIRNLERIRQENMDKYYRLDEKTLTEFKILTEQKFIVEKMKELSKIEFY